MYPNVSYTIIGMGGGGRKLVLFGLNWYSRRPDEFLEKVKARDSSVLEDNPRFARTIDCADTAAPSRMETRIHTPGLCQPRLRWKPIGDPLGAGQFGTVLKAVDIDSGKVMAVKLMTRSPRVAPLWSALKREVEILSGISHVRNTFHSPTGHHGANRTSASRPTLSTTFLLKVGKKAKRRSSWA